MLIETICSLPPALVMGAAALAGAMAYAGYSILKKKREDKKFKFDWKILADTVWQSTLTGALAGLAMGCGWSGLIFAMISGIGVDHLTNTLSVNKTQVLNFVQLIGAWLEKR